VRRIRWTRTIVFDGPEDWVLQCMARSWIVELGSFIRDGHVGEGINAFRIGTDKTAECTEYKVETYDTQDTQENTSEIGKG
jgi:hypothetical protein